MSDWAELPRERTRAEESRLREEAVREHEAVAEAANATAEAALGALRMYATDLRRDCGGCGDRGAAASCWHLPPPPPPPLPPPQQPKSCPNTCLGAPEKANNGVCDDGGPGAESSFCAFGTLCAGSNRSRHPNPCPLTLRVRSHTSYPKATT